MFQPSSATFPGSVSGTVTLFQVPLVSAGMMVVGVLLWVSRVTLASKAEGSAGPSG